MPIGEIRLLDLEILLVHRSDRTILVLGCRICITFKNGEGGFILTFVMPEAMLTGLMVSSSTVWRV